MNINKSAEATTKRARRSFDFLTIIQERLSSSPYIYLFFSFIIPIAIMYLVYVAMGIHPFGEESVLVLDLNGQYVYYFEALRNILHGGAEMFYSFSRSLSGEFMGIFAYYLASPLSFIVALFPTERMLDALLVLILLKVGFAGASFGYYLHRNSAHRNKLIIIAFSVMYALCSYATTYQENTMWMDALIWLPLVTLGIEQLIKHRRFKLYIVSLALAIISNFYIGYMICIYVVIYFFWYCFSHKNELDENRYLLRPLIRISIASVIAIAISAVIILPTYYSLSLGKTDFSNPSWAFTENFEILDFFTKFLPSSYDSVSYGGLPLVYGGVLMILLVPAYFAARSISSREKLSSLVVILFFVFSFIARPVDLIWHGFQFPNWLNYRYSFMLVFFMLVLAYKAIGNLKRVGIGFMIGTGAVLVIFTAICQKLEFESYINSDLKLQTYQTIWLTIIAAIILTALVCLLIRIKDKLKKESVSLALVAVVCIEIFCSTLSCFALHDTELSYSNYKPYNEFLSGLRPVVAELEENDPSFYRYEKTHHRKYNDNLALNIRGVSGSTSTLNASTIELLKKLGYASDAHWSKYLGGTPITDSLLGIKYIINDGSSKLLERYYSVESAGEKYVIYRNPYALSLAYGVSDSINELDLSAYISSFEATNALVDAMLGQDSADVFVPILIDNTEIKNLSRRSGYQDGYVKYENDSSTQNGTLTFEITVPNNEEIFMYVPSKYQRESKLSVSLNGSAAVSKGTIFAKETRRIISLGRYNKGDVLSVEIKLNNDSDNIFFIPTTTYFYYLDTAACTAALEGLLANPQFIIDEGYTDEHLDGQITTTEPSQTILTTIPYDEYWQIYLDGERVEYYKTIDSLIAFDIETAGEHTLTLTYKSGAVNAGIVITVCGLIIFTTACVVEHILKKKKKIFYVKDTAWVLEDLDPNTVDEPVEIFGIWAEKFLSLFKKRDKTSPHTDTDSNENTDDNGGN